MNSRRIQMELALLLTMLLGIMAVFEDEHLLYKASSLISTITIALYIFTVAVPGWVNALKDQSLQSLLSTGASVAMIIFVVVLIMALQGTEGFEDLDIQEVKIDVVIVISVGLMAIAALRFAYQRRHRKVHGDQNGDGKQIEEESSEGKE